jgi:hypothetical protein
MTLMVFFRRTSRASEWLWLCVLAGVAVTLAVPVRAQATPRMQLLGIPKDSVLHCRTLAPGDLHGKKAAVHLEISIGDGPFEEARTIDVAYDSSGRALSLVEVITRPPGTSGPMLESVAAKFAPDGSVGGIHPRYIEGSTPTAGGRPLPSHGLDEKCADAQRPTAITPYPRGATLRNSGSAANCGS